MKVKEYYKYTEQIDELIKLTNPTERDLKKLFDIISDDNELAVYFYRENTNGEWLSLLKQSRVFEELEDKSSINEWLPRVKAHYLVEIIDKKPKDVIDLITKLNTKDIIIQSIFLKAILKRPLDAADEGMSLIKRYLENDGFNVDWYGIGIQCAEFMTAISKKYPDKAFEIARIMLELRKSQKKEDYLDDIKSRFEQHDYEDLIFKHYKKLWEIDAFRSTILLINIFNTYLEELPKGDYRVKNGFNIVIERLDLIKESYPRQTTRAIIQGICESGKFVIAKQSEKTNELLDYLENLKKVIFKRIEMFLLRYVPTGTQKERINSIISNKEFLDKPFYEYEYKLLLMDKFEDISEQSKNIFINWVEQQARDDESKKRINEWFREKENRDATKEDYEKIEYADKARELYLVKERFPELYNDYQSKSGKKDEELKPVPMMGDISWSSGTEGSPLSKEEMLKMTTDEVIEYICNPSKWNIKKANETPFHSPKEALSHVFEEAVRQRADDYANLQIEQLRKLKPAFLQRYFNGVCNSFRENTLRKEHILNVLKNSQMILKNNIDNSAHERTFRLILDIIGLIFDREQLKKDVLPQNKDIIWHIIEKLTRYEDNTENEEIVSGETDPYSGCINCVSGEAFILLIRFGLFFKNLDEKEYNTEWSRKIKENLIHIIDNIKVPKVRCVLGVYFPQIHWMEKELIEERIDDIFDSTNNQMWKDIWGSYISWSRAYKNVFLFLEKKGKYAHAINEIGKHEEKPSYRRDIDEGLVQHLMVAYFNNWIEWNDDLLKQFFIKSSSELRGKAADFLKTGFKSVRGESDEARIREKGKRAEKYWKNRLKEISLNPEDNFKEAIEFVDWVLDTLIEPKRTLELTLKTLELTNGKLGTNRDEVSLIKGVCKIGEGDELLALKCINKMMQGKPQWISFSLYKEDLENFLKHITDLKEDTKNIKKIRREAIDLINAYGRRQVYELKPYYEQISKTLYI